MQYRSNEQETAINYDNQTGKWTIYSNFGPHARKFERALAEGARKEYTDSGTLIMIDGELNDADYRLSIARRVHMTEEQRRTNSERMRKMVEARKNGKASQKEEME